MKFRSYFMLLSMLFGFITSFSQKSDTDLQLKNRNYKRMVDGTIDFSVPLISVVELKKNKSDYILIDARELDEFQVSHIPGAMHIGYDNPDFTILDGYDKECKIVFYCSIGYRSEKIAEKALKLGFNNVQNLYGSIFEWVNEGYELVDPKGNKTKKVHAYNRLWGIWIKNKEYTKVYSSN